MSDNIQVAVRMRPLIKREKDGKASVHWKAEGSSVVQKNQPSTKFQFDRVFREIDTNEIIYTEFCSPLVRSVMDGFNGTIFAYGQTSSGKTFTMMGKDDGEELGIAHYTISDIFNHIQARSEREFLLRVSYMEIYNESVFDLLSGDRTNMKLIDRDGVIKVNGLSEHIVQKPEQVLQLMREGEKNRKIGQTNMNERSSRSHSIFQVIIESGVRGDDNSAVNVSQFNLVDLAGSERAAQTGAKETRLTESKFINLSLLMLSQVIRQLSEKPDQFINYRDSKLTRILQNSLGGNAKTAIICTITPATVEETLSTLKFATRAKHIRNKPHVNEVLTEQAHLKRYANEIKRLTQELEATKEEKDQENKSLKEQILKLQNKFVSQMAPTNEKRSTRRETWGGCLDANKFKVPFLPPIRKKYYSDAESYDSSFQVVNSRDSSLYPEKESLRMAERKWSNPLSDLSVVNEESELDSLDGTFLSRNSRLPSVGFSSAFTFSETGVQTDISTVENKMSLDPEEQIMNLQTRVNALVCELAELREFTSLEKQFCTENRIKSSLNFNENIEVSNLKSQIATLEKDVANHLKTISELQEDMELKNDELQLQSEIAECLKEELAAKDKEMNSYKVIQDTCTEVKLNCSSQTSYLEENDTEKFSLLDNEISKKARIISDLEYERDSKDKQIALCKDKIRIQEQIILSLQTEISLKTEENMSSNTPLHVNNSTQTFYLGDLSHDGHNRNNELEIGVFPSLNHSQEAENCYIESPIKNDAVDTEKSNHCEAFLENSDVSLELALKEFMDLKQFTFEFMEKNMDGVYFKEDCDSVSSEKPASVQNLIKRESNALKNLLHRIEFYLKNKCEMYEYFQGVLSDTSNEASELKSQLADAESQLRQTKEEMKDMHEEFKDLESKASLFLKEIEAPKSLEWKDSISSDKPCKALEYISLLKRVNKLLKYFVEDKKSSSSKRNSDLAVMENSSKKLSQAIQTTEDERLVQMSKELATLKAEKEKLVDDVSHLNLRVEKIKKFRAEAECEFKDKETRYKTEIQNLKSRFESEKSIWTENASKCVLSVEEKYDQMITEQEVKFCDELNSVKNQLKELVAKHEKEMTNLKKDHLEKMTDVQDQLSKEIKENMNKNLELENTIRNLKKENSSRAEMITKLKYKYNSYALELRKLRASAEKLTCEVGVQTSLGHSEDKQRKAEILNRNVVTKESSVQTYAAEENDGAAALRKNEALRKEVEDLKQDLSSKLMLLRSCRCRLPFNLHKPSGEKSLELNKNTERTDPKKAEKRGGIIFSSAAEVLQSDIVKKALELEVERERCKLGDSGTASTLVNCKLKKDLNAKNRALEAAKREIAELKAYAKRRNALPVKENLPLSSSEDVTEYNPGSNPYPHGEIPKLPTKNMLKEKNKVPEINHPAANKIDPLCEKPVYSNVNPSQAPCVKNKKNGNQDVEEFRKGLHRFESCEPECKQQ